MCRGLLCDWPINPERLYLFLPNKRHPLRLDDLDFKTFNFRSESRTASLVIHERPSVSLNPSGVIELREGDSLQLVCSARGNPKPSMSWDKLTQYRYLFKLLASLFSVVQIK